MSNILKVLITVFIIGLVVMAIIFFSIFGIVPAEKLSEAFKRNASTSTEDGKTVVVSTTTVIERIIEREVLVERDEEDEEEPEEEPIVYQPPVDTEPPKFEERYEYAFIISGGEFSPSTITVKEREDVVIGLTSRDNVYTLNIPSYGLSQTVRPGEEKVIAFQALDVGEFEIICEGCREGFEAKLVVE
jgi:heme/copper-type cytochrome/quinol oxidase subunit 2